MGSLIRAKDWSKTALGSPDKWPQSLQTMVAFMLDNPFGMSISWGEEYTQIYNDAYKEIIGNNKHPEALGISKKETFPELWQQIAPRLEQTMQGNHLSFKDLMVPLNRNGSVEELYFDFSYSPITTGDGSVGGVLVTAIETTAKKMAEKAAKETNERFRNKMHQAPVGITILRGSDFVVEMANESYLQIVDKSEDQFVGVPLFQSLREVEEYFRPILEGVYNTGIPYRGNEIAANINRYGKKDLCYFDFIYHPVKEDDGSITGVMAIVTEVTDKVNARAATEEKKRLYETITQNTPDLIYVFDLNYRFTYANEALLKMWGLSWEEAIGKTMPEVGYENWHSDMHIAEINQIIATKKPIRGEVSFPHSELGDRVYDYIFAPIIDNNGNVTSIAGTTRDITPQVEARKLIEQSEQRFRKTVQQAPVAMGIVRGDNFVVEVANDRQLEIWGKTIDEVLNIPFFTALPESAGQGLEEILEEIYKTGKPYIANELPYTLTRNGVLETFYLNFVCEPLFDKNNKIDGLLSVSIEVTEQVIARRKIEESEQRFEAAINAVQGILWTNNGIGEMEGEQLGWASLTGQTYAEYQGIGWANAVHPDDREPSVVAWNEAVRERKTFIFEHRVKTFEGVYRDFSVRAVPLLNADDTIRQWVGVHTDITESKQAAKALKDNEEKLTIVIEASELGTWELDVNSNIVTGSPRLYEIMGYPDKDLITLEDNAKRIHPDYIIAREEAFKKAYETGIFYFSGQIVREDNSVHWIEKKGKVFYDDNNMPISVIGTIADITADKKQQQILFESEQKFRLLADSMPQHIWTADPQGKMNYFNQSVYDFSGLTPEQVDRDGWIQIVHPDDKEKNIAAWVESITTGKDFHFEHRFRRHDGEFHWQLSRAIPQRDEKGNIQMWVGTSTDIQDHITFTRELERQVSERTKQLELNNVELQKMNKELQSFAYISSHDLQEPLRKIQIFASRIVAKEESNLSANGKDMFKRMQSSAKRMQTLIQDLLAYSRTNPTEYKLETVNLQLIIDEIKEDLDEELKEKGGLIVSKEMCEVAIIPFQFRQVMLNLVSNALKFSRPDHPPVIEINCKIGLGEEFANPQLSPLKKYCHIELKDNGIGFEQQYSEKIFEVFQRLHGKHEFIGTGIGLSIVKKIVENHHGIVTASSELNKGATFDIYIPSN